MRIRRRKLLALLLVFGLVGVVAAQVWSNTLTWTLTADDPTWVIAWDDPPPTTLILGSEQDMNITMTRTFEGDYDGFFEWTCTTAPTNGTATIYNYFDGYQNFTIGLGESCLFDFSMYNNTLTGTYYFGIVINEGVGAWDFDVLLTGGH